MEGRFLGVSSAAPIVFTGAEVHVVGWGGGSVRGHRRQRTKTGPVGPLSPSQLAVSKPSSCRRAPCPGFQHGGPPCCHGLGHGPWAMGSPFRGPWLVHPPPPWGHQSTFLLPLWSSVPFPTLTASSEKDAFEERDGRQNIQPEEKMLGASALFRALCYMLYIHSFCCSLIRWFSKYFVCWLCVRRCASLWGYNDEQ